MKRRNVDCPKPRRSLKRPKIDGFYGSSFMYLKFLLVWLLVIGADFLFEFRFEYLWPFWLLLRSVYDSFRYQGFAFSILFVCMALTSDMICILFIPVNWLFFAASTYVWVQFIWHTEKGFCMPTVLLWALFIYMEALVRLKDLRNTPFHLDLCRPFAAHCIGYPVVTLGFGLKSYVGFRLRQRKQRDVAKRNNVYFQLLEEALPSYLRTSSPSEGQTETRNGSVSQDVSISSIVSNSNNAVASGAHKSRTHKSDSKGDYHANSEISPPPKNKVATGPLSVELEYMQQKMWSSSKSVNDYDETEVEKDKNPKSSTPQTGSIPNSLDHDKKKSNNSTQMNGSAKLVGSHTNNLRDPSSVNSSKDRKNKNKESSQAPKDESAISIIRLESDVKRLKADLQASRQTEQELRNQVNTLISSEKSTRSEMNQLQQDNDNLQNKLHNLVTARQSDRSTMNGLERKLQDEKKTRQAAESQVTQLERKIKKLEELNQNKERALANAKLECTDSCRSRRGEIEGELRRMRRDHRASEDRVRGLERENTALRACKDQQSETEVLMSALSAMQDKTAHLETSLSAETKVKLDLFSALGEAKRQTELSQSIISSKDKEIEELKKKIAEIMAMSPQPSFQPNPIESSRMCFSSKMQNSAARGLMMSDNFLDASFDPVVGHSYPCGSQNSPLSPSANHSNLDPNARVYTPKSSLHSDCDMFNNL